MLENTRRQPIDARGLRHAARLILLCCLVASPLPAGDWPQWRGPTHDAHATDEKLADSWPAEGPPVLWTRELGQGYSAFVVSGNRAYTQVQSLYEQNLVCLDADTGETIWSYRYGWPYDGGGLYPGPRATPAIVDGLVYFAAPDGLIGCVDAATGSPVWSSNYKSRYDGKGTDFGVAASPMVWQSKLIIPVGGTGASVIAVDARTGAEIWKCGDGPASYATPTVVPFQNRSLVITPLENSILCADAETGKKQWELDLSTGYDEHSAAPVYREPLLMFAGPFRSGAKCYRVVAEGDGCRLESVWEQTQMSNDITSSVLIGDHLLGFDLRDPQSRLQRPSRGQYRCLDWNTGRILWSSELPGHANAIVADDKLLLFNDRGELRLGRVDAEGYHELAKSTVLGDEICWTPPALSNGRVFLRSQTRAVCLFIGKEESRRSQPTQTVESIPKARRFDALILLGGEREFPAAVPEMDELHLWFQWTAGLLITCWALFLLIPKSLHRLRSGLTENGELQAGSRINSITSGVYWISLVAAGALASPLLNPRLDALIFTWPLAIWALMQFAVERSLDAIRTRTRAAAWQARGAILLFVLGCAAYFHACRLSGLALEWAFLTGFVIAAPLAMLMARFLGRSRNVWLVLIAHTLSYSACYWAGVAFMKWKTQVGS